MTTAFDCSGRCAMTIERAAALVVTSLALAASVAVADPLPEPPLDAQAAHQVLLEAGLRQRLLGDDGLPVRRLDPAIFLDVSPVTATEPALRLPEDQREAE